MKLSKLNKKIKIKVGSIVKTVICDTVYYTIIEEIKFSRVYGKWETDPKKCERSKNYTGCIDIKECEIYEIK